MIQATSRSCDASSLPFRAACPVLDRCCEWSRHSVHINNRLHVPGNVLVKEQLPGVATQPVPEGVTRPEVQTSDLACCRVTLNLGPSHRRFGLLLMQTCRGFSLVKPFWVDRCLESGQSGFRTLQATAMPTQRHTRCQARGCTLPCITFSSEVA